MLSVCGPKLSHNKVRITGLYDILNMLTNFIGFHNPFVGFLFCFSDSSQVSVLCSLPIVGTLARFLKPCPLPFQRSTIVDVFVCDLTHLSLVSLRRVLKIGDGLRSTLHSGIS